MDKLKRARYTARYHYDASCGASVRYKAAKTLNESEAFEILDREIDDLQNKSKSKDTLITDLKAQVHRVQLSHLDQKHRADELVGKHWNCKDEIAELEAVVEESIADEAELPGEMSDDMWNAIKNDRDACTKSHQIAVKQTKQNILERFRAAKPSKALDEVRAGVLTDVLRENPFQGPAVAPLREWLEDRAAALRGRK